MKVPLRFQVTEFDCGTVSLLNAFSYLFNRKKYQLNLLKLFIVIRLIVMMNMVILVKVELVEKL
ncbi:MAG: hypothetical protein IJ018_00580 [Bacilli bacterium]|nr:hypothetical protein [Bacilli bacterium]